MKFAEFKKMPRGTLRFENAEVILDVWPYFTTKKVYQWNVFNKVTGVYDDCGIKLTEDAAMEAALESAKI